MTSEVVLIIVAAALMAWAIWLFINRLSGSLIEIVAEIRAVRHAIERKHKNDRD